MTPKEKAEEMVEKYNLNKNLFFFNSENQSKICALIAVDEMLGNAGMIWGGRNTETGLTARDDFRKYWREVKEEIEKL